MIIQSVWPVVVNLMSSHSDPAGEDLWKLAPVSGELALQPPLTVCGAGRPMLKRLVVQIPPHLSLSLLPYNTLDPSKRREVVSGGWRACLGQV